MNNKITFCTKRNTYGHRYYLTLDLDRKIFDRADRWFSSDYIELKHADMNALQDSLLEASYSIVNRIEEV